jgi:fused signal recognition particle receptor
MSEESENQGSGWWGSTLGKLKSALARTKGNLVDPLLDEGEQGSEDTPASAPQNFDRSAPSATQSGSSPITTAAGASTAAGSESGAASSTSSSTSTFASTPTPSPAVSAASTKSISAPSIESQAAQNAPKAAVSSQMTVSRPVPQRPPVTINDEYLEELEEKLIRADLGVATAEALVQDLRKDAKAKNWNSHDVEAFLKKEFSSMLATDSASKLKFVPGKLNIYLVVGVNGTGKTTSIGKLAWRFKSEGKKVLMAAADTFRAAAESQLEIWSERAGVEIVRLADGADPGAVVYQALERAQKEEFEVLVIDTAGRLHNKANLMAELKKVRGVVEKKGANASLESLLVLDASTGQNGLQQAKVFTEVCPLTGVILTKLDGTAKGGVVFSINRELKIPVKLIGLGEKMDDLRDFEPGLFVEALFQR